MFNFFIRKYEDENPQCPLEPDMQQWMEESFLWLTEEFFSHDILVKPILLPTPTHFPIIYDGSKETMFKTAAIIAKQMEIDLATVELETYQSTVNPVKQRARGTGYAAGVYFSKNEEGKFEVFVVEDILQRPVDLVAVLAHEFAHIKLLGENRKAENDELLTDLTPVVFGLGIFGANSAYTEYKSNTAFGWSKTGYLMQQEWGYALALYAAYRNLQSPDWLRYLPVNVQADFKKSMRYITANKAIVFKKTANE